MGSPESEQKLAAGDRGGESLLGKGSKVSSIHSKGPESSRGKKLDLNGSARANSAREERVLGRDTSPEANDAH